MFKTPSMDRKAMDLPLSDYRQYSRNHNIFPTTFEVNKSSAMPDLNGVLVSAALSGWGAQDGCVGYFRY